MSDHDKGKKKGEHFKNGGSGGCGCFNIGVGLFLVVWAAIHADLEDTTGRCDRQHTWLLWAGISQIAIGVVLTFSGGFNCVAACVTPCCCTDDDGTIKKACAWVLKIVGYKTCLIQLTLGAFWIGWLIYGIVVFLPIGYDGGFDDGSECAELNKAGFVVVILYLCLLGLAAILLPIVIILLCAAPWIIAAIAMKKGGGMQDLAKMEAAILEMQQGMQVAADGVKTLCQGAKDGDEAAVEKMLSGGIDVNIAVGNLGLTPLYFAAEAGHAAVVKLLIAHKCDVDLATKDDNSTPLFAAAQKGHGAVVQLLIAAGADVDKAKTTTGSTPLYTAARKGHLPVVELLIAASADIDKARTDGVTPLIIAANYGHGAVVAMLLERGADKTLAHTSGATALSIAKGQGHNAIVALLEDSAPFMIRTDVSTEV